MSWTIQQVFAWHSIQMTYFKLILMNIFVAKLNYSTSEETLRSLFEQVGEVSSAKVIMDRETGRSKGFGFVEMPNDDEGLKAIEQLDGFNLDERHIIVNKAKPREQTNRRY